MTATESMNDVKEFRDTLKELPTAVKEELVKNVSLIEAAYHIGYSIGRRETQATA